MALIFIQNTNSFQKSKVEDRLHQKQEEAEEKRKILVQKEKPSFKPYITEKSQKLSLNKSKIYDHPWQNRSRSPINRSYLETEVYPPIDENEAEDMYPEKFNRSAIIRSTTPTPTATRYRFDPLTSKKTAVGPSGPYEKKIFNAPKVNEVDYTPAIEFLLKKIA